MMLNADPATDPARSAVERDPWLLILDGRCDYAFNMACDEALLEGAQAVGQPVLRFYGWEQPAASFGYSQHIADIEKVTRLRPLVRRPTGGGLVPHDADWTYSVAVPPTHAWYELRATESYERVHRWIEAAFARLGVTTELAPCCRKEIPGQCFAGYEQFDVLWLGRKIAGAAQRRTKSGLLIQGSVQPQPATVAREQWQASMCEAGRERWNCDFTQASLPSALAQRAQALQETKYSRTEYNARR